MSVLNSEVHILKAIFLLMMENFLILEEKKINRFFLWIFKINERLKFKNLLNLLISKKFLIYQMRVNLTLIVPVLLHQKEMK